MKTVHGKVFFLQLISLLILGCTPAEKPTTQATDAGTDKQVEAVRVLELGYSEISRKATYTAHLQPFRDVHLVPASPGRVARIHPVVGSRVTQGQLLVEMDRTQLQQALVQLKSLETDYNRLDTLRRAGSVSQQQYDQVRTQYDLLRSNVAFLEGNTRLVAPFSGVVSAKYFEDGEMFSGAPNTTAGKAAILYLIQTDKLKGRVNVAERFLPQVRIGMDAAISTNVYPNNTFGGTVSKIYPEVDPLTRTFRIELTIPNPDDKLRPGMFARATLDFEHVETLVVPALAVLKLQGSNERFVFLEKNGTAHRVVVELGERFDDMVEIRSDAIKAGDRLIIAGQGRLHDGDAVEAQK